MMQRRNIETRTVARATEAEPRHSEASLLAAGSEVLLAWSAFNNTAATAPDSSAAAREWEYSRDNNRAEIRIRRSRDDGATWGEPSVLVENSAGINTMQPALVALENGDIGLSFSVRDSPTRARRLFRRSSDGGHTWTEPVDMTGEPGYITAAHHRLIRHSSGRLIQPCHRLSGDELQTIITVSDDDGESWNVMAALTLERRPNNPHQWGVWEAAIAELPDGDLFLVARTSEGQLYSTRSSDSGSTWSKPAATGIVAPSAPAIVIAAAKALIIIHNIGYDAAAVLCGPRNSLIASVSYDAGRTWARQVQLFNDASRWFHYPAALRIHNEWLLALSTTNPRTRTWNLELANIPATQLIGEGR